MAGRLVATAGAAAVGGAAAVQYNDELNLANILKWGAARVSGGATASAPVAPPAAAPPAPVIPQISITTSNADSGTSMISWRLAAAIGSGVAAGIYWAYKSGVTLQDLTWVTQSVFNGAVDELQTAVASTQSAIEKCHEEVGMQIDELEQQVNDTRDHLEHTIKTEVGDNREMIQEVQQQLGETDATICELKRQVATRKQLEELRALVDKMKSTGDSTYEELKQLHSEIRALAAVLIQHQTENLQFYDQSSGRSGLQSLTMGTLGTKISEALALAERQAGLTLANSPLSEPTQQLSKSVAQSVEPQPEEVDDRAFTPPTEPEPVALTGGVTVSPRSMSAQRLSLRTGLLRTNRNF